MNMKFRVWSKKYKMFTNNPFYPNNQHTHSRFVMSEYGNIMELVTTDYENYFWDITNHKETELVCQWFTGFLDVDNTEIYEGDIINLKVKPGEDYIAEILWCEENSAFQPKSETGGAYLNQDYLINFKVVGNIFETPELLK